MNSRAFVIAIAMVAASVAYEEAQTGAEKTTSRKNLPAAVKATVDQESVGNEITLELNADGTPVEK